MKILLWLGIAGVYEDYNNESEKVYANRNSSFEEKIDQLGILRETRISRVERAKLFIFLVWFVSVAFIIWCMSKGWLRTSVIMNYMGL